jgi:hypothetical protein
VSDAIVKSAPVAVGVRGAELADIESLQRLATMIVASGLAPKGDQMPTVAVKILLGLELGLPPMASLKTICVINGRPSIFGDAGKALLLASGKLAKAPEIAWFGTPDRDDWECVVRMERVGMPGTFVGSYSVADAKRAKLWGKAGPWTEHTRNQIKWRAWWFAAREGFADVLSGVSSAEESLDLPKDVEAEEAPSEPPKALAARVLAKLEQQAIVEPGATGEACEPEDEKTEAPPAEPAAEVAFAQPEEGDGPPPGWKLEGDPVAHNPRGSRRKPREPH